MTSFAARILRYLAPHRLTLAWALAQVLLITACELLKPWPLKIVIDGVLLGQALPWGVGAGWAPGTLLAAACAALVLVHAAAGALTVQSNLTTIGVGQRMVSDLRGDLYAHLHRLSLGFHGRARVGDLLYRVTADTFALQTLTMNCLIPAASALLLLAGMTAIMLRMDAALTVLALAVGPALLAAIARLNARVARAAGAAREGESEVYAEVQRSMSSVRLIQAFAREEDEQRRFMTASRASLAASLRLYTLQTVYSAVVGAVIAVGTAAVVWVGARHVLDGTLTVGALVVFVSYLASLYAPINSLFQTWGLAQSARVGVQRVFDLLDVEREIGDGPRSFPAGGARGDIAWDDVSFGYAPDRLVLRGVTLRVRPGQTVAIVGPTGAGKSTLLGLVPRFHDPVSGRVLIDGRDVREYRLASLRRQVAMVLQPPLVLPATLAENIAFGRPGASRADIEAAARLAQIHGAIAALPDGYDTAVGERGVTLSEGEKQRLTIARAMLRDAPILLLDEPTSSLDAETEALVMESLARLAAGRTVLVIAHRLSTIRRADVIVVLREGRIAEQGSYAELIRRGGAFAALHRLQADPGRSEPLVVP